MAREDTPSTKPLVDTLGVKEGQRVAVLGVDDPDFLQQALRKGADIRVGRRRTAADMMVVGVERREDLPRLHTHREFIARDGAIWVVWPKGSPDVNENDVRDAALDAGLVDVKVVSFSPTRSALKLVYRLRDR